MKKQQRNMVGHGTVILLVGMLTGFGLLVSLLGGMELIPGTIISFSIPGDPGSWARAHLGGMLNGMLIMLVAVLITTLSLSARVAGHLYWMLVGTGYANTLFYLAALLAPNRALSFADNQFGESSIFAVIGLLPALVFVVVSIIAITMLAVNAFKSAESLADCSERVE
ncbi:styrene-oxide isomerase StyC [Pseudomonas borbori]|uniref:Styrene-oxide isomerase n=1 Tax=Pseudomonas borbori TaxID=289003 RepID=A0A1I5XHT0_9PSED|nr:hypothetical protein [Pseudomonas borbori]SFQ31529.1 hypothetical protein SAMN05216190_1618 [Pseudomonas borbori]